MQVNIKAPFVMFQSLFFRCIGTSFFLAAVFFLLPYNVFANVSHIVTPLVIDIEAEGRDIITKTVTVTNTGDQMMTLYPTVNSISSIPGSDPVVTDVSTAPPDRTTSLVSWIEISRAGLDIKPGEKKELTLTIRVAPEPVAGEYHAFIGFPSGGFRDEAERKLKTEKVPGVVLSVTIQKKTNEILRLSKFVVDRFVTKSDNQAAAFTFVNPGDEALVPKGEIIFYKTTGQEVGSVTVNDENISIPPGQEHTFTTIVPVDGLFGKYKAFLTVAYGNTGRATVHDTSFFYIMPMRELIIGGVVGMFLIALLAWYMHRTYFEADVDDSDRVTLHIRPGERDAKDHDINLKTPS